MNIVRPRPDPSLILIVRRYTRIRGRIRTPELVEAENQLNQAVRHAGSCVVDGYSYVWDAVDRSVKRCRTTPRVIPTQRTAFLAERWSELEAVVVVPRRKEHMTP